MVHYKTQLSAFEKIVITGDHYFDKYILLAPLIFGLISLWLGADANWDLANYHRYNPFAFFHHKLTLDLAPAGLQTYFNPTLDFPYYWMSNHLPAPLVGFTMGFFHGLNFIFLALIIREALISLGTKEPGKLAIYLTIFGCFTANFASGLGTTMGDDSTAVFNLAGLFLIIKNITTPPSSRIQLLSRTLIAGMLLGAATGLKLTNAPFALALCLSYLILPINTLEKLCLAFVFSVGVCIGLALLGGYWYYSMYEHFGNPLFPQYSQYFHNELTRDIGAADTRWGPTSWKEYLAWPVILSWYPHRVGELGHHQFIWALLYTLTLLSFAKILITKKLLSTWQERSAIISYLSSFVTLGFILWMLVFSVQRYLVAVEVFTPLMLYLLIRQWTNHVRARKYSLRTLTGLTLLIFIMGAKTWGHNPWAEKMFDAQVPPLIAADTTTVILAGHAPLAWVATLFPENTAFVQIEGNFPANFPAYKEKIHNILQTRGHEVYALFQGEELSRAARIKKRIKKLNHFSNLMHISTNHRGCNFIQFLIHTLKADKKVQLIPSTLNSDGCQLQALNLDQPDHIKTTEDFQNNAELKLQKYGFSLAKNTCITYHAFIGKKAYPYQWCEVKKYSKNIRGQRKIKS